VGAHLDFDPMDASSAADRLAMAAGEVAAAGALVGHLPLDHDDSAMVLLAQGQGRPRVGTEDDDLACGRGGAGDRQDNEGDRQEHADHELAAMGDWHPRHLKHVHRLTNDKLERDICSSCTIPAYCCLY
jgi:hypothetical protein